MDLKEKIIEIGLTQGFHNIVIGSLANLDQGAQIYDQWLEKGYSATMDYLKRDPYKRTTPSLTLPGSRSVIIASVSYYSEPDKEPPAVAGRVARYAVGLDYHNVIRARLRDYAAAIEKEIGRPLIRKPFTDDVALFEQSLAARHGLGFVGKNSLILGPRLSGSYNFIAELFVDLDLEPGQEYKGTCGNCFRCGTACPTAAIKDGAFVDANLCISFLTIENKNGIDISLREHLGDWVFGCDICQEVCPYNQKSPHTVWPELKAKAGVGHHLDLLHLLQIDNDLAFRQQFEKSPVRRPKLRGLLRNGLVVLGNHLAAGHPESDRIVHAINKFCQNQSDPMLLEHAHWALGRSV